MNLLIQETQPESTIPYGYCHCGCGGKTALHAGNRYNIRHDKNSGIWRKDGEPKKYIENHWVSNIHEREDLNGSPFRIDGVLCKLIGLTQGQYALVEEVDYEWATQWRWIANADKNYFIPRFYAVRLHCFLLLSGEKKRTRISLHRAIMDRADILSLSDPLQGDHENGITLDCRRSNLRRANTSEQHINRPIQRNNSTGRKGVIPYGNKFKAKIAAYGRVRHIRNPEDGTQIFSSLQEAGDAYDFVAEFIHGDFRRAGGNILLTPPQKK